jgi:hypothetical protein
MTVGYIQIYEIIKPFIAFLSHHSVLAQNSPITHTGISPLAKNVRFLGPLLLFS